MCGIVGALVANGSVTKGRVEGRSVLEYRGYDSAGVAGVKGGEVGVRKRRGRLANLEEALSDGARDGARGVAAERLTDDADIIKIDLGEIFVLNGSVF